MHKKSRILTLMAIAALGGLMWTLASVPDTSVAPNDTMDTDGRMVLNGAAVDYTEGVTGYLALPEGEGRFPALILIHEWWGLNDNIRQFADDFAAEGYVVLAVDLYNGESTGTPDRARELATSVSSDLDGAFANLAAAVDFLNVREDVRPDSLASVGWCFGGGWSYQLASNDLGVDTSVIYYGRFNPEDDLSIMRAKMLGHFGEEDLSIPVEDVRSLEAKLKTLDGEHQIFIYPNAGHAFANVDNEMSYVPEAAELSWERTLDFLSRVFGN